MQSKMTKKGIKRKRHEGKKARREKVMKEKNRILLTGASRGCRHRSGCASASANANASAVESHCCKMAKREIKGGKTRRKNGNKEKNRKLLTGAVRGSRHHRGCARAGASAKTSTIESRYSITSVCAL